jgi:leader peptidase (prepilin peptidase)/N-methyltransferase
MEIMAYPFASVLGLVIGSFLNVVIWRLPRKESLSHPASHCPGCNQPVKPYDNIPVFSWVFLRGHCRNCGERISPRYPLVEAITALLYVAVLLAKGVDSDAWLGLAFVTMLVPIAFIDYDHRIIPNRILLIGTVAALGILAAVDSGSLPENLISGAAAGTFFFLAVLAYPAGMGMGDVKLAAVMGLFLGRAVAPALMIALFTGVVVGGAIMARKGVAEGRKTKVPFGPFLVLGALVALFGGDAIVHWYSHAFLHSS